MTDGYELLKLLFDHDAHDDLFWNCSGPYAPITFFIQCSDVFYWATADLEKVTSENLPILRQSYEDAGNLYGGDLFCARVRGMRPQRPYLKQIRDEKIKELFLACGPERDPKDEG